MRKRMAVLIALCVIAGTGCTLTHSFAKPKEVATLEPCAISISFHPVEAGAQRSVAEVVLYNPTENSLSITNVSLGNKKLGISHKPTSKNLASAFSFDVGGRSFRPNIKESPLPEPLWWNFIPSPTIPRKGYVSFRLSINPDRISDRKINFYLSDGNVISARIPIRPTIAAHPVSTPAFSEMGDRVSILYRGRSKVVAFYLNGRRQKLTSLNSSYSGNFSVLSANLSAPVTNGMPVFIRIIFDDGSETTAFLRALTGVVFDGVAAFEDNGDKMLDGAAAQSLGFDKVTRVMRLPFDPLCADAKSGREGNSAPDMASALSVFRPAYADILPAVDFCASMRPGVFATYGFLGDAVILKPYQLHWGKDRRNFQRTEGDATAYAVKTVAPLPVLWVPERFKAERMLSPVELRNEAWTALMRGARGIRCHHSADGSFTRDPSVKQAFISLGQEVADMRDKLSTAVPVSYSVGESYTVCEAWSADDGVLLFVRSEEDIPVRFLYTLPDWMEKTTVTDVLGNSVPKVQQSGRRLVITLDSAQSGILLWLPRVR